MLTKVSNSPILLKATADKAKGEAAAIQRAGVDEAVGLIPERAQIDDVNLSGKITLCHSLSDSQMTPIQYLGKLLALAKLLKVIRSVGVDVIIIDPNTPCNTHDLLECPCEGLTNTLDVPAAADTQDDDEVDGESAQGFVKACDLKPEAIDKMDRAYMQRKKVGLAALGEWKHINCLRASSRDDIQDDILRRLIDYHELSTKEDAPQNPKSRIDSLLSAVDLHNIVAMDKVFTVKDVPGGSVSYLFEKSSTSCLDEVVDE
ncbi:hypothetical protein H0H81_008306 [Sphagnurus paluster]|uniref:Uncharacterized protein n=1 Tax=Sphagnurus paluster TaxID=117069 RepID=A0A9P7K4B2_9AGAR|nr:hypothetical protein H0H81_008306 [Sphagnurus paluster]